MEVGKEAEMSSTLKTYFFRSVRYLNGIAVIAGLWAFFYPLPYRPVIALNAIVFLSAMAAFVCSKGAIPLDEPKKSKTAHVSYAVAFSALALAWRAFSDFHFVHSRDLILPVGAVYCSVAVIFYLLTRDYTMRKARVYTTAFLFLFAFSFGAVTEINGLFPFGSPIKYTAKIVDKQISSGTEGPDLYYLIASPWGARKSNNKLVVTKRTYDGFRIEDEVTILVRQGAFAIPHYRVVRKQ